MDAFVDGLVTELDFRRNEIDEPFNTIYIGGGTPSILSPDILSRLFDVLPVKETQEITLEVNPEDVTARNVDSWLNLGINRISIGVQSLHDDLLRFFGRRHSACEALNAIQLLRNGGLDNISADLIYGVPGLSSDMWHEDLQKLMSTGITHLSAYTLTYHEGTFLYRMLQKGKITPADDEEIEIQFDILRKEAASSGFEHYEISNFARTGYRSRHNSSYWNPFSKWLGIGPSAHSFDGHVRRINYPALAPWLKELPTPYEVDDENDLDLVNDNIVTSLRTIDGLDINTIPSEYRLSLLSEAAPYIESGAMQYSNQRLKISPDKWLISDFYIRNLIQA